MNKFVKFLLMVALFVAVALVGAWAYFANKGQIVPSGFLLLAVIVGAIVGGLIGLAMIKNPDDDGDKMSDD